MLKTIDIKNIALIDSMEIDFREGLNIITGETGAGKSIIVDSLMLALGERAYTDIIRQGEQKAIVECRFGIAPDSKIHRKLAEENIETDGKEILIRREVPVKGSSRCFINDSLIQLGFLKQIGDLLVDFHGQHDHQSLLRPETHAGILDMSGDYGKQISDYQGIFQELTRDISDLQSLRKREKTLRETGEFQRMQLDEIMKVDPQPAEDAGIEEELSILQNAEFLFNTTAELYELLFESEDSARNKLLNALRSLKGLGEIDKSFNEFMQEVESAVITLDEVSKFAKNYNENVVFDPRKIEELRLRLLRINGLKKKYGTMEDVLEKKRMLEESLSLAENFDEEIRRLSEDIDKKQVRLGEAGAALSKSRKKQSVRLAEAIEKALVNMGIANGRFEIRIEQEKLGRDTGKEQAPAAVISGEQYRAFPEGIDKIEFYISLNKGETPKPLINVASGGEISRIMLAIKSILAGSDQIPVLVFDEIDTGISGRIAQKVGTVMKSLANHHQVIAITHLPQIAAMGDRNITVRKIEGDKRTRVSAKPLNGEERLAEIARLLSGETITEAALQSARELTNLPGNNE